MEQKNDPHPGGQLAGPDARSAAQMQEDNANGDRQNEQGQASFFTGTTIGGGSNFGQGSAHLGIESYHQGERAGRGSNYENEAEGLGRSAADPGIEDSLAPMASQSGSSTEEGILGDVRLEEVTGIYPRSAGRVSGRPSRGFWRQSSTEGE